MRTAVAAIVAVSLCAVPRVVEGHAGGGGRELPAGLTWFDPQPLHDAAAFADPLVRSVHHGREIVVGHDPLGDMEARPDDPHVAHVCTRLNDG